MKLETATGLLTWKNAEVEEITLLEFAQQYENLTDEQKSDLIKTAKSAHKEYVQEMMRRVREPGRPRIQIELSGEVKEEEIQDSMEFVDYVNEDMKPKGRKMKLDTVNLSLVSATP
jgi:pyruvate-formate lyase-activating enzyme